MPKDNCVVGIDIGTTKICAAIGEPHRDGGIRIVGVGLAPSKALRRGVVVNIDEAVESIATAIERAERVSGHKIVSAYLTITGGQVASLNNRGVVAIANGDRAVTPEDVERAVEAARVVNIPTNREIIHAIPRHFIVDGQEGIRNPVGMLGYRLDVEAHLVTAAVTSIQNLSKCVQRLGVDVDGIVLEPLASGEAVLTDEEKEMGVVVADIGGGTTGIAVYVEGSVWHTAVLPVGGNHITNDIAVGLRTPFATAEEIKVAYASALGTQVDEDDEIEISTFGRTHRDRISRTQLCEIVEARLVEIISLIQAEIGNSGYDGLLPAGVVLTGGGAQLEGMADLAAEYLKIPVRIGVPWDIEGLVDSISAPAYAAAVGLLLWGTRTSAESLGSATEPRWARRGRESRARSQEVTVYNKVREWFRAFLP